MLHGWNDGMGAGGWILMSVFWVGLVAALIWAGARLFARPSPVAGVARSGERPEEILARRLAVGEIDAGTYDALRKKLRETS